MAALGTVSINEGKVLRLWFEVDQFREPTQVSSDTSAPYTEDDKEGTRYTTSPTGEQVTLIPSVTYALNDDSILFAYSSDNPTEIDVAPDGQIVFMVAPEATASAIITIVATSGTATTTRTVSVTLTLSGASVIEVIEGGVAGSARKALSDPIDTSLSGTNPATQQKVYTTQDPYVRNTSFFLQGTHAEALTCASPWNSAGGTRRAGTAITPRHAVCAKHYPVPVGATMRFITSDNTVITRTVVQAGIVTTSSQDAWMVLLDSDLPASITPCKLFPDGYETYLPAGASSVAAYALPLLAMDFSENGIVLDFIDQFLKSNGSPFAFYGAPTLPDRLAFYDPIISGDSGNPIFAVIGSELWLLSTFFGAGSGPFYGGLVTELNAMITTLDTLQGDITGHTVTVGDLSSYTAY
tara:strand:+ start:1486 stop:2715 length:1230 start_codon:yes stop_codon:yes gene_type:complete